MAPRVGSRPLALPPCSARPLSPPRPRRTVCSAPRQAAPPPPPRLLRPSFVRSARPAPAAPSAPPLSRPRRPPRPRCQRWWRGPSAAPEVLGQPRAARAHACPGLEYKEKLAPGSSPGPTSTVQSALSRHRHPCDNKSNRASVHGTLTVSFR